jgi:hypothetical protein
VECEVIRWWVWWTPVVLPVPVLLVRVRLRVRVFVRQARIPLMVLRFQSA